MNWKYNLYTVRDGKYICHGQYTWNDERITHKMCELLEHYSPNEILLCKPEDIIKVQMECVQ